jgi:predicted RNA binding protein YcfA (HicA-like mRNA interferase family)
MTKREKREIAMRSNPKNVSFEDLDLVLSDNGFTSMRPSGGSSHVTYSHPRLPDILTIPIRKPHVKRPYVEQAIKAIDAARAAAAEKGGTE